jgi:hypothetical protein
MVQLGALESVESIERSPPQTGQLADPLELDFVALFLRGEARWWLARQLQSQFLRQNQPALIDGGNPNIDRLDFCQLLQHRRGRQPRSVRQ